MTGAAHLPDFFIIGAMKSGTSTLQAQLAAQPGIFMTTPKEPNFFSDDDVYARGTNWYISLFEAAGPDDLTGEASTHYTKLPTYPQTVSRMQTLPGAPRFIYVIRDPVERALSQYLHEWGLGTVGHDVAAAFSEHPEFLAYSRYPEQLAPYMEHFGPETLLLTSLEALKADPQRELSRIGAHLGCPHPFVWNPDLGARNVSADRVRPLPFHGLLVRNPVARALRHALVPKSLRARVKATRKLKERPELPPDLRAELEQTFTPDYASLNRLFPGFAALDLSYPYATGANTRPDDAGARLLSPGSSSAAV